MSKSLREQLKQLADAGEVPSSKAKDKQESSNSQPGRNKANKGKGARKPNGGSVSKPTNQISRGSKPRPKKKRPVPGISMAAIQAAYGSSTPKQASALEVKALKPEIHFRDDEPRYWSASAENAELQFPAANGCSEVLDWNGDPDNYEQIALGFDFGTSAVKVMAQLSDGSVVPVEFSNNTDNAYVLPTKLHVHGDVAALTSSSGSLCFRNLKLDLIEHPNSQEAQLKAAAFIALALRLVRGKLFDLLPKVLRGKLIVWDINFGVPASLHGDTNTLRAFTDVFNLACFASVKEEDVSEMHLGNLARWLKERAWEVEDVKETLFHDVYVVQEIAAQIFGLMKSETWDPNTRFMSVVDIGAGTVDLGYFSVTRVDDEQRINFLKTDVRENGVAIFHRNRIQALLDNFAGKLGDHQRYLNDLLELSDINQVLPEEFTGYISGMAVDHMANPDQRFASDKYNHQVSSVAKQVKQKRYPNPLDWPNVPVLLCGGGANESIYGKYFDSNKPSSLRQIGFSLKQLIRPRKVRDSGVPELAYQRLSLAYGLSFPTLRGLSLVEEKDISDIALQRQERSQTGMVSKDDV